MINRVFRQVPSLLDLEVELKVLNLEYTFLKKHMRVRLGLVLAERIFMLLYTRNDTITAVILFKIR